jgi:UDP-glucose 4-epimerase
MKVLITGISGALARKVAVRLATAGHTVLGLDRRPWPDAPDNIEVFEADLRKRPAEDVFRLHRPDAVIHMGTVTHLSAATEERYRINLHGTRAVFEHGNQYGVGQTLFIGRHTVYGAAPDAPLYHSESDPPLGASTYPALSDLVAADLFAGSALWQWPEMCTSVLRIVYVLGPSQRGTLASYLSGPFVPTVLGFDPLFHFMHEEDAAHAIVLALEARLRGVYNVAGPQPVPISVLARVIGKRTLPLPEPLFHRALGKFGLPWLPRGAESHVKYPVVIDGSRFEAETGFAPEWSEKATMESFRWPG